MEKDRLSAEDWVDAGLEALRGGVNAVRVEVLAKRLGVSKGSFYWHFANRRALLDAMLERWRSLATQAVIDRVEKRGGAPAQRLRRLFRITTQSEADTIESAIRAWGMSDDAVRAVLAETDRVRMAYVADLFVAHGVPRTDARRFARSLYLALIGEFTWVSHGGATTPSAVWETLLARMLA